MIVDKVILNDKASDIVIEEQAKYAKKGTVMGRARIIYLLLIELSERRLLDSINPPNPLSNENWNKYLKT